IKKNLEFCIIAIVNKPREPLKEPTDSETITLLGQNSRVSFPMACRRTRSKDSPGNTMYWTGYKLHVDSIDGGIPCPQCYWCPEHLLEGYSV
ncbi:MAG: hypothetical protein ACKVOH_06830, partial [Chlamydiales bacterium]